MDVPVDTRLWPLRSLDSYLNNETVDREKLKGILLSNGEIESRINKLRKELFKFYKGKDLFVLTILNGAATFRDRLFLSEHFNIEHQYDFVKASSYRGTESGVLSVDGQKLDEVAKKVNGKHVLIVEDIVDTGKTLAKILEHLYSTNAWSVKICTLLDKREKRLSQYTNLLPDYCGFIIADHWVIGYGLDTDDNFRNLPHIYVMNS